MLLLILFFLCPIFVNAEIIHTPYLFQGFVEEGYSLKENEKVEERSEYIFQKEEDLYIFSKWSSWQNQRIFGLDEEMKTVYYYHRLQPIDRINFTNIHHLSIMSVKIFLRDGHMLIKNFENVPLALKRDFVIFLDSFYYPEDLEIEIETFLWQEKETGSFFIRGIDKDYIEKKVYVTKKGRYCYQQLFINCLAKMKWDKKVYHSKNIDHLFYYILIKKEQMYRYRFKIYNKYVLPVVITSNQETIDGYRLLEKRKKYALYRREVFEIYDQIVLDGYVDICKIIKSSTAPLKDLFFELNKKNSKYYISIHYQSFTFEKEVIFSNIVYSKSKVIIGNNPSFTRKLISKLLKLSIKKIF